jgi:uncharacterized protein (DUF1501 family)
MTSDLLKSPILHPSRRSFLASAGALVAWAQMPKLAFAAVEDPRLVVVILRGALDGLAAVPPIGDPGYAALRGDMAIGAAGHEAALPLDGFFGLNDAMPNFHRRYQQGDALIVHATATAYRERSHFDGQDVLENGMPSPQAANTGWLNRAVGILPVAGRIAPVTGLAVSPTVPLILRGPAPVLSWTPQSFRPAGTDTAERLMDLYRHQDPELARVFEAGMELNMMTMGDMGGPAAGQLRDGYTAIAQGTANLLLEPEGPRIAVLSFDGWDTHVAEGAENGRLAGLLAALDSGLETLATGIEPIWRQTAVVVVTEFGRTARGNGDDGTDHGTGTVALLLGGAIAGGRVLTDWPGLQTAELLDGRDLNPTIDLRGVLKGVLRDHLGLSAQALADTVFPESGAVSPISGLVA